MEAFILLCEGNYISGIMLCPLLLCHFGGVVALVISVPRLRKITLLVLVSFTCGGALVSCESQRYLIRPSGVRLSRVFGTGRARWCFVFWGRLWFPVRELDIYGALLLRLPKVEHGDPDYPVNARPESNGGLSDARHVDYPVPPDMQARPSRCFRKQNDPSSVSRRNSSFCG